MPTMTEAVRRFAEEPEALVKEPEPPARRILTPSYCLLLSPSPTQSTVSRVRTSVEGLDDTIAEIRGILKKAGYTRAVWMVGPSCRPEGLATLLMNRGFVPASRQPFEPESTAMAVAAQPLQRPPANVEARLVRTYDEFLQALRICTEAFDESEEDAAGWLAAAPDLWKQQDGIDKFTHIAFLDGRPVGFGFTATGPDGLFLAGSGVLASARRRGAYRALIAARWDEGVKLGKPALVVHAGTASRPILEGCGFERVCSVSAFDDPAVS